MNRKILISSLLALVLLMVPCGTALAATSQEVTVTATPSYISISNLPNSFDFGVITASTTPNTTTGWFTVTNDSTVNITVSIGCDGWTSWTYGASDEDQGQLNASDNDGAYDVTVPSTGSTALHTTSSAGDDFQWEMELEAPDDFTSGAEQTTHVTITAAAA